MSRLEIADNLFPIRICCIPYHSLDVRDGAAFLTIVWILFAIDLSGSGIDSIFAITDSSESVSPFNSLILSFIASLSSSVNPENFLLGPSSMLAPFLGMVGAFSKHLLSVVICNYVFLAKNADWSACAFMVYGC